MNKFQKTEVLVAALTLTVFAAGTVFAAPPGPPPTPNAPSASFSSVTVAPTSGSGISITGASGTPAMVATSPNTNGIEGTTSSTTAAGIYGASGTGYGVIGVGNAVNKAGVYGTSINGSGVYGSGGGNGVLGVSGGAFPSAGTYGLSTNSSGVGLYGVNSGAAGTGMGIYGYSGNNHGIFGYSGSKNGLWGRSDDATGTYAGVYGYSGASTGVSGYTNSGTAGRFQSTAGALVNLANNSYALDVAGAPSRFNTAVDLQGAINNSSVLNAGYVRFSDNIVMDPGRQLYTSTVRGETYDSATNTSQTTSLGLVGFPDVTINAMGGQVKLNGQLAGLFPNAVTVKDPQGFAIENYSGSGNPAGTITLQITENGEIANTTSSPVILRDDDGLLVRNISGSQTFLNINNKGQTTINGPGSGDFWLDTLTLNTASYGGAALDANNTNTSSGFGVRGSGTVGVSGSGSVNGISGTASGTGTGVSGSAPSTTSGQAGLFYNGLYTVYLATPTYGINSSGPIYATSTATGSNATITANLPASYNGNGVNATVNNAGSYGVYSNNSAGGYAYYGIGNMYLSGTPYKPGGGSWSIPSDLRLKDVKSNYERGLDAILKLNPIVYNYKADNVEKLPSDKEYVGLAAQEVQKVIPEAVNTDKLGYLNINNDPIIWTMLNSIKELANRFVDMQTEMTQLKKANSELLDKVAGLEERLAKLEQKSN